MFLADAIMPDESDYISVNRSAYDRLAAEYRGRADADRVKDASIIAPFVEYLTHRFGLKARILDIGPGNGVNLAMFRERGFQVSGIDISSEMLRVAKELCPAADLRLGDFLATPYASESFQGVFSKASIHLFPKKDALRVSPNRWKFATTHLSREEIDGNWSLRFEVFCFHT